MVLTNYHRTLFVPLDSLNFVSKAFSVSIDQVSESVPSDWLVARLPFLLP